ncbi:MAG: hypothetical protein IJX67_12155 [Oscillospiraceae bacterium]|nr:hypothetical protein [Oscillospiraceae bacterium]
MANLSVSGMDELIAAMQEADIFDEATQTELLAAGSEHLRDVIREEVVRAPYNLKFVSQKLTKQRKAKKDKNGNYYMSVSVSGKNERGERNATVAFVLNYGRSETYGKIPGSYFWTRAVKRSENTVVPVYEAIITEKYKERGLI